MGGGGWVVAAASGLPEPREAARRGCGLVSQHRRSPWQRADRNERPQDPWNGQTTPRAERAEAWQQIAAAAPRFAQYQRKTDRELPIIRLISPFG
jgi:F420H(2)-dependent quinone reductase